MKWLFPVLGFVGALGTFGPASAQMPVSACNVIIGPNGAQVCAPSLSSKAFPGTLTNSVVGLKTTAGIVSLVHCYNPNASEIVLQFFNAAPANVVLGTTAPYAIVPIAPTMTGGWSLSPLAVGFSTAISVAATTTANGAVAPGILPDCNVYYQ